MIKNILIYTVLVTALYTASCDEILLGEKGDMKISMLYLERQSGEDLRVSFHLQTEDLVKYNEAYMSICCHTPAPVVPDPAPIEEVPSDQNNDTITTPSGNGRRNLADVGQCFGIAFTCLQKVGCTNSLEISTSLYHSQLKSGTQKWEVNLNDMYKGNIGALTVGSNTDFTTRYKFNKQDAISSNIPRVNEPSHITCYSAFNIERKNSILQYEQNLADSTKFTSTKDISVLVNQDELTADEGESSAFGKSISLSVLAFLILMFTTL